MNAVAREGVATTTTTTGQARAQTTPIRGDVGLVGAEVEVAAAEAWTNAVVAAEAMATNVEALPLKMERGAVALPPLAEVVVSTIAVEEVEVLTTGVEVGVGTVVTTILLRRETARA